MRKSTGCWTCRIRRKRCDEKRPICDACTALQITCHNDQEHRPEWMDGGPRQEAMSDQIKREVKENAHRRRGERPTNTPGSRSPVPEVLLDEFAGPPQELHSGRPGSTCPLAQKDRDGFTCGRDDTVLLTFYLDNLLPLFFPFYRPSFLEGGRSWVLQLMMGSPVVRQTTLCHISHFSSLARDETGGGDLWANTLNQSTTAFGLLREALQVINEAGIADHLHGTVRILASIMQVERFEINMTSFHHWQTHLNAATTVFRQLLSNAGDTGSFGNRYRVLIGHLNPLLPSGLNHHIQSAEQAALRFSSSLLIFDDIIASTVLQEQPKLYECHQSLLSGHEPAINLEAVLGVKNWILLHMGEIATLAAWKRQCNTAGNLDVMELVHRATVIKESLVAHLMLLETDPEMDSGSKNNLLDVITPPPGHRSMVNRVWTHAALIYLTITVAGMQSSNADVPYHVSRIFDLLKCPSPPVLLRSLVWPFCVAGCLAAEPAQQASFRRMVEVLQPRSIFGTVHKALEIMENAWRHSGTDSAVRDLASCFTIRGDTVLLV